MITATAETFDRDVKRLLSSVGMSEAEQDRFRGLATDIHRAAIKAGAALEDLARLKLRYDESIHAALGDANYAQYVEFESLRPARRELGEMMDFAKRRGLPIGGPESHSSVAALMRDSDAITLRCLDGPYDPAPNPTLDPRLGIRRAEESIARLRTAVPRLLDSVMAAGLSSDYREAILGYYEAKLQEQEAHVRSMRLPKEERLRQLRLRIVGTLPGSP